MPSFKPAYLIHGDDHGRISERRARLRALAEAQSGSGGLELFENERSSPGTVAAALSSLTFAIGRRFLIVEGVERWKEKELGPLPAVLGAIAPETTVAFFAREDGRLKAPAALAKAVAAAGGDVSAEQTVKGRELPRWVVARARELGLTLDGSAAATLVRQVGERQQRLLRELEKLALELGPGATVDAEQVHELTASSSERKAWTLADALLGGDPAVAVGEFLTLRAQGERVPGLLYWMTSRLRQAATVAEALDRGEAIGQIRRGLRMPPAAADALIAGARRAGLPRLRQAIAELADLELASRGGGGRSRAEDTAAVLAISRIAA